VTVTLEPLQVASSGYWRPLAITAGVVGGAGLVIAIATGAVLADKHGAILRDCPNKLCTPAGRALINSAAPIGDVNLGAWILTVTGAAASAVFFYLDLRGQKPDTTVVPAALPGGGGLWVTRRF
jgi:hypothetical protein